MARVAARMPGATLEWVVRFPDSAIVRSRIEHSFGRALSDGDWALLVNICDTHLTFAQAEHRAPRLAIAAERLTAIQKRAGELQRLLSLMDHEDPLRSDALNQLNSMFRAAFEDMRARFPDEDAYRRSGGVDSAEALWHTLQIALEVAGHVQKRLGELGKADGLAWRPGDAWRAWIGNLAAFGEVRGLIPTARKDSDKNKTGQQSPFVAFAWALQQEFPTVEAEPDFTFKRHNTSADTFAKEVSKALRHRVRDQ